MLVESAVTKYQSRHADAIVAAGITLMHAEAIHHQAAPLDLRMFCLLVVRLRSQDLERWARRLTARSGTEQRREIERLLS